VNHTVVSATVTDQISGYTPAMCAVGSALVDSFNAAVAELSALQGVDRSVDRASASLLKRIDQAAQDAMSARSILAEHLGRCSFCSRLRLD